MKKSIILLALCLAFCGCSKDYGVPTTQYYPIHGFYDGLEISDAFDVTVSDQVDDVEITVGELAHSRVIAEVVRGTLRIGFEGFTFYRGVPKAVIPARNPVSFLNLSGASSYIGDVVGRNVEINLSGASLCRAYVETDLLDIHLSGASTANLQGFSSATMIIEESGASQLRAFDLTSSAVEGTMSGASTAEVNCCSALRVDLSGASHITYQTLSRTCHPIIDCPVSGGSTVRERY